MERLERLMVAVVILAVALVGVFVCVGPLRSELSDATVREDVRWRNAGPRPSAPVPSIPGPRPLAPSTDSSIPHPWPLAPETHPSVPRPLAPSTRPLAPSPSPSP